MNCLARIRLAIYEVLRAIVEADFDDLAGFMPDIKRVFRHRHDLST